MRQYVIALDQGTTSSRCILFDADESIAAMAQKETTQIYPKAGWVEQDPMEIYATIYGTMSEALAQGNIQPGQIAAIGITNQRETTILWDKETGEPVYNAIVWQCRRTADLCRQLKAQGLEPMVQEKTGLLIDGYFSATKIRWILDNVSQARQLAEQGRLLFGTVDTWLLWKLTGGQVHKTDYTNASRTMLFNIHTLQWDDELLEALQIPRSILGLQKYLWHRLLFADEYRQHHCPQQKRPPDHHSLWAAGQSDLCAGRQRFCRGQCGAVAAG